MRLLYTSITESMKKMKRKIWKTGSIRILLALMAASYPAVCLTGCGTAQPQRQTSVDTAMGTVVTQTLYVQPDEEKTKETGLEESESAGEDSAENGTAQEETAQILQLLVNLERQELSWRETGSEVAEINARAQKREEWAGGVGQEEAQDPRFNHAAGETDEGEGMITLPISAAMQQYLSQIWQISQDSGGALDVTLGRLSRLWNIDELADSGAYTINRETGREEPESTAAADGIPTAQQIQEALEDTGYERVALAEGTITLPAGMQLDLGAVGKGIACDRISEYLHGQSRITGAVVAVGGSVVTYGQKPDGSPWSVAVMHPRVTGEYLGILELFGEHYVSTSGDYERYVLVDGVRYHHILDPETGYPADSGLCSVTIVCDSGLQADALSTACFVLGPERGLELAERYGAEALLVTEDGQLYMTEGMEEIFTVLWTGSME